MVVLSPNPTIARSVRASVARTPYRCEALMPEGTRDRKLDAADLFHILE